MGNDLEMANKSICLAIFLFASTEARPVARRVIAQLHNDLLLGKTCISSPEPALAHALRRLQLIHHMKILWEKNEGHFSLFCPV